MLVYGMVASVLSGCSRSLSDSKDGFYASLGYEEMSYAPDYLSTSFEAFHKGLMYDRDITKWTPEAVDRQKE